MLKFCSLFSGSSGNSFFVKSDSANILIDIGVSAKKIETVLRRTKCKFKQYRCYTCNT